MIEITQAAQGYFQKLLAQQDESGLGLRISVVHPGTPHANCDLQFCPEGHHRDDDIRVGYPDFDLYVELKSEPWLDQAQIDFEENPTGGQLTIRAPGIKGTEPSAGDPIDRRIQWVLDTEVNPALASHGGRVSLVEITGEMEAVLQFGGGCHGCGMADVTLKQGIEKTLLQKVPEITAVIDATDHRSGKNPYYAAGSKGQSAV